VNRRGAAAQNFEIAKSQAKAMRVMYSTPCDSPGIVPINTIILILVDSIGVETFLFFGTTPAVSPVILRELR
jgi:hypothetical protein